MSEPFSKSDFDELYKQKVSKAVSGKGVKVDFSVLDPSKEGRGVQILAELLAQQLVYRVCGSRSSVRWRG